MDHIKSVVPTEGAGESVLSYLCALKREINLAMTGLDSAIRAEGERASERIEAAVPFELLYIAAEGDVLTKITKICTKKQPAAALLEIGDAVRNTGMLTARSMALVLTNGHDKHAVISFPMADTDSYEAVSTDRACDPRSWKWYKRNRGGAQ